MTDRQKGSVRLKSAHTYDNVAAVEELVVNQKDKQQTNQSTRQISREIGVFQSYVVGIIQHDVSLRCFKKRGSKELTAENRDARLARSKRLLKTYLENDEGFISFTGEKVFTVPMPENPQNDHVYAPAVSIKRRIAPERLLRTRSTFRKSPMVFVGVSKLGENRPNVRRSWGEDQWCILP